MKSGITLTSILLLFSSLLTAQIPSWIWSRSPEGNAISRSVAVGPAGNVFICGSFEDNLLFDSTVSLTASLYDDMFIASYDQYGMIVWAKNASGNYSDEARCIITSLSGSIYVAGEYFSNNIIFDSITLTNNQITPYHDNAMKDVFLTKYNNNGNVVWAKSGGGINMDFVRGISIDVKGNVTIVGTFWDSITTFGQYTLTNTGNIDVYIVRYDSNGNVLWAKNPSGPDEDNAYSVTADKNGNVYVVGSFRGNYIQFDRIKLYCSSEKFDAYIVEYGPDGNALWAENASGNDWDEAKAVAVDESGNIYLTGYFSSDSLRFDSEVIEKSNSDNIDMFLVMYDSSHNLAWTKRSGGNIWSWVYPNSITTDRSGNIYVAGVFIGDGLEFDSIELPGTGSYDGYLVMYNHDGNVMGAESMGGSGMDWCESIDRDTSGHVCLTGFFESSSMTLGDTTFQNVPYNRKVFLGEKISDVTEPMIGKRICSLTEGWNLISIPLKLKDGRRSNIFPSSSSAFIYDEGYISCDTLTEGIGYWLKNDHKEIDTLTGELIIDKTIEVKSGWNIIGTLSEEIDSAQILTLPHNIIRSSFFIYDSCYKRVQTILPGKGYWIKVSDNGHLILSKRTYLQGYIRAR